MQVFRGVISDTEVPVLSGGGTLMFPDDADMAAPTLAFQRGLRLSQNLQQGHSYIVHAIAEDLNRPKANRMATFCSTGSPEPLVCTLVDPPCIQDLRVDCPCIDSASAQVSVTIGKRDTNADEGYAMDYVILDAYLPGDAVRINSTMFPLPTVAQVRAGTPPVSSARLAASGTFCVANGVESTFSVPQGSAGALQPGRDYVLCAVPEEVANFTCGGGVPTCVPFTTHDDIVDVSCEMSQACDCSAADGSCRMEVRCAAPRPTLVKYRVSPSSCGALPAMYCPQLFSCSEYSCCPAMAASANQDSECCPTLAEGVMCVDAAIAVAEITGMEQCGGVDVIVCGARSASEKCDGGCSATVPCARGGAAAVGGLSLEAVEAQRQAVCATSVLTWQPAGSGGVCERVVPAAPAAPAPMTTTFSAPTLLRQACGSDTCPPALCEVSICEPGAAGSCVSGTPVAEAYSDVYVLGDSASSVCCVRLPYDPALPSAVDVLAGVLPDGVAGAQHECIEMGAAREWETVAFTPTVSSQIFMVRFCLCDCMSCHRPSPQQ